MRTAGRNFSTITSDGLGAAPSIDAMPPTPLRGLGGVPAAGSNPPPSPIIDGPTGGRGRSPIATGRYISENDLTDDIPMPRGMPPKLRWPWCEDARPRRAPPTRVLNRVLGAPRRIRVAPRPCPMPRARLRRYAMTSRAPDAHDHDGRAPCALCASPYVFA